MLKTAVFPVGGFGVRFLPVTKAIPKEMLPILNKPIIQFAVEEALDLGVERIIFVTGRGKTAIENYFDYSYELEHLVKTRYKCCDVITSFLSPPGNVSYIRQQEPLGLGHAVWCARQYVEGPFFVVLADDLVYGDNPLKQLFDMYEKNDKANILLLKEVSKSLVDKYGIADADSVEDCYKVNNVVEKPSADMCLSNLAIVGRYILQPRIFNYLGQFNVGKNQEIQLTDAIKDDIAQGGEVYASLIKGEHFDCGSIDGLLKATVKQALKCGFKEKMQEWIN